MSPEHTRDDDRLLGELAGGRLTPSTLATRYAMSLRELAAWVSARENAAVLDALRALADAQSAIVISRVRARAARRLIAIARDRESPETARKACVDLLSLKPAGPITPDAPARDTHEDTVRSLLETLGAQEPAS